MDAASLSYLNPLPLSPTPCPCPPRPGTGRTKKSGAGGKFTWGGVLADEDAAPPDRGDPNYDSGGDEGGPVALVGDRSAQITDFKREVRREVAHKLGGGVLVLCALVVSL